MKNLLNKVTVLNTLKCCLKKHLTNDYSEENNRFLQ